jgi:glycerophosphoryl diester phosphodiesterase
MLLPLLAGPGRGPFISAHRGFSDAAPENTLPALEAALAAGADVAEIDVKLTSDGHLVLMHDATLDRTTSGQGPVGAMTLAQIKTLDAGAWFGASFAGTPVVTLDEVLEWSAGRLGILLEMKNCPERDPHFIDAVIEAIERHDASGWVIPAGFDHPTVDAVAARRPQWTTELIMHCRLSDVLYAARSPGPRLISLEPEYVVQADIEALHKAGIPVLTTVLSVEHGRELIRMGVDVLEANDVTIAVDALKAEGRR